MSGPFELLDGHPYMRMTTYRRSGEPVPTTVWFAIVDGRVYVFTDLHSGKARRIRNNPRVMLTPSNFIGRPRAASRPRHASWTRTKKTSPAGR